MIEEIWKKVPYDGYSHYEVSNLGRLRNTNSSKVLKLSERNGYSTIIIYNKNQFKWFKIHRLVAMVFIDNPENKKYVNHKNGIKKDNRSDNLEWCTPSENMKHAYNTGLKKGAKGQDSWFTTLTEEDVTYIRNSVRIGTKIPRELAEEFDISEAGIRNITRRSTWKHMR